MSINRPEAEARLQRALDAWRVVAASCRDDSRKAVIYMAGRPVPALAIPLDDLERLADGFDLMSALWSELQSLTRECDVAAHFIQAKSAPGKVEITIPREDGRAPMTLKMDAGEAKDLGMLLVKAGQVAEGSSQALGKHIEVRTDDLMRRYGHSAVMPRKPPDNWDTSFCYDRELCGCPPGGCCPCACHEARGREADAELNRLNEGVPVAQATAPAPNTALGPRRGIDR